MCVLKKAELTFEEKELANSLRNEILEGLNAGQKESIKKDYQAFVLISRNLPKKKSQISEILKMNEDEILDFVEKNDIKQLSKLSVDELNYIGEILGVKPEILVEGTN